MNSVGIRAIVSCSILAAGLGIVSACRTRDASERIGHVTFAPGNLDVFLRERPGQPLSRLTDDPARDEDAVLSPDGRWVVFCSERRGGPDLWVLDLRGSRAPRLILDSDAMEDQPALSPDGTTVAFVGTAGGSADIYVIPFRPETTLRMDDAVNLTHSAVGEFRPSFSPDGARIAFSSDRDSAPTGPSVARQRKGDVYVMNRDGSSPRRLTESSDWNGSPAWLPDGRTIVFSSARVDLDAHVTGKGGVTAHLMTILADGGGSPAPLLPATRGASSASAAADLSPSPMPGGRIAFARREGPFEPSRGWSIVSVDGAASDPRAETRRGETCWAPSFSAASGAMVCTGPGPAGTAPSTPVIQMLGEGPFLDPQAPTAVALPDRTLDLYPFRAFTVAMHPTEDLVARTDAPADADLGRLDSFEARLLVSAPDGGRSRVLYTFERGQDPAVPIAWSSDGAWLAFMKGAIFGPPDALADVWRIGRDGQGAVNVTRGVRGNDGFADVSADGTRIVFRSGRTGNNDIFLAGSDGSGPRNLTLHPSNDTFPSISPRGNLVVFCSDREGDADPVTGQRTFEIYALEVAVDGSPGRLRRLTTSAGQDAHPRFSPDGEWIVFTSERGGMNDEEPLIKSLVFAPQAYGEIHALRLRDDLVVRLTHNKWEDGMPSWAGPILGP